MLNVTQVKLFLFLTETGTTSTYTEPIPFAMNHATRLYATNEEITYNILHVFTINNKFAMQSIEMISFAWVCTTVQQNTKQYT